MYFHPQFDFDTLLSYRYAIDLTYRKWETKGFFNLLLTMTSVRVKAKRLPERLHWAQEGMISDEKISLLLNVNSMYRHIF